MHPELNPYSPGSGRNPPVMVGRSDQVNAFDLKVARSRNGFSDRGMVLYGYRGVGKTVLLNAFRAQAETAGWLVLGIEGRPVGTDHLPLRRQIGRALAHAGEGFRRGKSFSPRVRHAFGALASFVITYGADAQRLGVPPTPGRCDSGDLATDLDELIEDFAPALRESSSAIGIFIDEMQDLDRNLISALLTAQHRAGQGDAVPFFLVGAGLPSLPAVLGESKSYSERLFDYCHIDTLTYEDAAEALVAPAQQHGAEMDDLAVRLLVEASGQYPYFVQTFGEAAWNCAPGRRITEEVAREAILEGRRALDQGFYPARWDRTSTIEREFMRAMVAAGVESSAVGDIARAMGQDTHAFDKTQRGLIDKGIIFVPEPEKVAFTVPGMPSYIARQLDVGNRVPSTNGHDQELKVPE